MTYAKGSGYTRQHQMSVNNKRIDISRQDILRVANSIGVNQAKANEIMDKTCDVFSRFTSFIETDIPEKMIKEITNNIMLL